MFALPPAFHSIRRARASSRIRMVAASARVAVPPGDMVPLAMPEIRPSPTAQAMGWTA